MGRWGKRRKRGLVRMVDVGHIWATTSVCLILTLGVPGCGGFGDGAFTSKQAAACTPVPAMRRQAVALWYPVLLALRGGSNSEECGGREEPIFREARRDPELQEEAIKVSHPFLRGGVWSDSPRNGSAASARVCSAVASSHCAPNNPIPDVPPLL